MRPRPGRAAAGLALALVAGAGSWSLFAVVRPDGTARPAATSTSAAETSAPTTTEPPRYRSETPLAVPGHPGRPTRLAIAADPAAPMLVFFHGQNGSIANVRERSGLDVAAEAADVSVLWLSGAAVPTRSWNTNGRCCDPASTRGIDDLAYVDAALAEARAAGVRARTVVSVGVSNGGGMAVTVGCRLPGRFDGAASIAGWIPVSCSGAGISLLAVGGTRDESLGAARARSMAGTWRSSVSPCAGGGERVRVGKATITTWAACEAGSIVRLVELAGVGHVWPRFDYYDATADVIDFARRLDAGSAG